jgi:3-oxoacyl-(acyl-carrier-protein) synthase
MVLGEGAGVMVLEDEATARARGADILGFVRGYGAAADAYHLTQPHPQGRGLAHAMDRALISAGLPPESVDYINLHGTATAYNDIAEYRALAAVFGGALGPIPASSTKAMTGHTLGAAGALEAIFCLLAMNDGFVPPNLNLQNPDPEIKDLRLVRNPGERADMTVAVSNSQGFGGECGCLVLERGEGRESDGC